MGSRRRGAGIGRLRAFSAVFGAFALASLAAGSDARTRAAPQVLPDDSLPVVAVATVLNEVKCDYLDFARSDYARQKRLAVGKVTGTIRLSLSRDGTRAGAVGVPVAPAALRIDDAAGAATAPDDTLSLPVTFDPDLALNPDAPGAGCDPRSRLARPILEFTGLAAALSGATREIGSPIRYRGQFYLRRRDDGATDVVLARATPARLGAEAIYLQSFDLAIETGAASWFADADGPPRPAPPVAVAQRPRVRVPTAPHPAGSRAAPPTRVSQGRCVADPRGAIACY